MEDRIAKFLKDFEWMIQCASMDFPFGVELEEAVCLVKDLKDEILDLKEQLAKVNKKDY